MTESFREPDPFPGFDTEEPTNPADFAEEHDNTSLAEQLRGGPEGVDEPESPDGLSGMDE
jgi:hypothetical protein